MTNFPFLLGTDGFLGTEGFHGTFCAKTEKVLNKAERVALVGDVLASVLPMHTRLSLIAL